MVHGGLFGETIPVKVIDVETKKVIKQYPSIAKAALYLGVSDKIVRSMCIKRTRAYSPLLQKEIACRVDKANN